jgi:hypothetical protein
VVLAPQTQQISRPIIQSNAPRGGTGQGFPISSTGLKKLIAQIPRLKSPRDPNTGVSRRPARFPTNPSVAPDVATAPTPQRITIPGQENATPTTVAYKPSIEQSGGLFATLSVLLKDPLVRDAYNEVRTTGGMA